MLGTYTYYHPSLAFILLSPQPSNLPFLNRLCKGNVRASPGMMQRCSRLPHRQESLRLATEQYTRDEARQTAYASENVRQIRVR